jgi:prepilin-type N-terminal cleavage/methylation domain-containing protein
MQHGSKTRSEAGFSLLELMIAVGIMAIVGGAVAALMRDSMKVTVTTYELTDAQEGLRISQEYLNRDLMNAGDGLNSLTNIRLTSSFVTNYLTRNPSVDFNNFGILTSDDNVPASIAVRGTSPAVTVRSAPALTDRITILAIDSTFVPVTPSAIDSTGGVVTIAAAAVGNFAEGEVYFITSSVGSTFGTVTSITGTGATRSLNFANGDTFGLNVTGNSGQITTVSAGGALATSIQRMKIIHYYVNSNGLLMRRIFGVKGSGFSESVIAEHIVSVQFRYILALTNANGTVVQPVRLLTSAQQTATRQVEVTVTAETPHSIGSTQANGLAQVTMTTSTSVRNMQFKQAMQPQAGG